MPHITTNADFTAIISIICFRASIFRKRSGNALSHLRTDHSECKLWRFRHLHSLNCGSGNGFGNVLDRAHSYSEIVILKTTVFRCITTPACAPSNDQVDFVWRTEKLRSTVDYWTKVNLPVKSNNKSVKWVCMLYLRGRFPGPFRLNPVH